MSPSESSSQYESPLNGVFAPLGGDAEAALRVGAVAWAESGVTERHAHTRIRSDANGWIATARRAAAALQVPAMLALIGPRGTGKTQMAVELLREYCRSGRTGVYVRTMDLLIEVRDTYGDGATRREREVLRRYRTTQLLVLDEVQVRGATEWEQNLLTNLLDTRYAGNLSTILISNLNAAAFVASVGDSIASRLMETGGIIECDWPSFRNMWDNV